MTFNNTYSGIFASIITRSPIVLVSTSIGSRVVNPPGIEVGLLPLAVEHKQRLVLY